MGAWIDTHYTGGKPPADMTAQTAFNALTGKNASIGCWGHTVPANNATASEFTTFRNAGMIPLLNLGFSTQPSMCDYITAGNYDSALVTGAINPMLAYGHSAFVRFFHEANGTWYDWAANSNGNTPAKFVAAWQHVVNLFRSSGVTTASFIWCLNIDYPSPGVALANWNTIYPGDAYVDWVAMDGYAKVGSTQTPTQAFGTTYDAITQTVAPSKPIMICETGTIEQTTTGFDKAGWIQNLIQILPTRMPRVSALIYFDEDFGVNQQYQLNTSVGASLAWRQGVGAVNFMPNIYGAFDQDPIPEPTYATPRAAGGWRT